MNLQLLLCFCLLAIANTRFVERILRGHNAVKEEFPNVVAVFGSYRPIPGSNATNYIFCGGTMYTLKWITVTSVCVSRIDRIIPMERILVWAGCTYINRPELHSQARFINFYRTYEQDRRDSFGKIIDLGLLRVAAAFNVSNVVAPRRFSTSHTYPSGLVRIAGYGAVTLETPIDVGDRLQFVEVDLLSANVCREAVFLLLAQRDTLLPIDRTAAYHFCTGTNTETIRGPSFGDGGTAVMQFNTTTREYDVIGIVSKSSENRDLAVNIFTPRFVPWINSVIERFGNAYI